MRQANSEVLVENLLNQTKAKCVDSHILSAEFSQY